MVHTRAGSRVEGTGSIHKFAEEVVLQVPGQEEQHEGGAAGELRVVLKDSGFPGASS